MSAGRDPGGVCLVVGLSVLPFEQLSIHLRLEGLRTEFASTHRGLVIWLHLEDVHLVVVDLAMGDAFVLEVARAVRARSTDLPVVLWAAEPPAELHPELRALRVEVRGPAEGRDLLETLPPRRPEEPQAPQRFSLR